MENDHELKVNDSQNRFEFNIEGDTAFIEFMRTGDNYMLVHTEVPAAFEGKGVGKDLVAKTLEYIKTENGKFTPSCSFVNAYVKRHPEWQEYVSKE